MPMRLTIQRKLFYSHFLAVVLVSGSIGTFFYHSAVSNLFSSLQVRLKNSAAIISRVIDAEDLAGIRSPEDTQTAVYQKYLKLLRDFEDANKDIAFIYVMRKQEDGIVFVIDSDRTEAQALPGRSYTAKAPHMITGFTTLIADDKITCDEWGCFLSGYAPLKNSRDDYLLGIDMRADEVNRKFRDIRIAGVISLLFSFILAYLFSFWLARRITLPIRLLVKRTSEIADGVFVGQVDINTRDEIGDLAKAFNGMSIRLDESHSRNQQAMADLKEARDSLESRVKDRTARIVEVNERLVKEIEERKRAESALEKAATTDYLTGLLNRRAMTGFLDHEVQRIRRSGVESSIILIDIDNFKYINDNYGHETGDRVLVAAAHNLKAALRSQDVIDRWGGEELLILLPETALAGAVGVAEKIRTGFADRPLDIGDQPINITVSIGVCVMTAGMSIDECFRRADKALYRAKSEGRNRTVAADEEIELI